jgi:hypothetical protein
VQAGAADSRAALTGHDTMTTATTEPTHLNPIWSFEGQRHDVPGSFAPALLALLTWGEEHGLASNSFAVKELTTYKGVDYRRAYKLGGWLNKQKRDIHWVDSEGLSVRLTIIYERGLFFTHVSHRDQNNATCDPPTCEAMFSGLARVIKAGFDRPCATQRSGVGSSSCVREWEPNDLEIHGESIDVALVVYNGMFEKVFGFESAGASAP